MSSIRFSQWPVGGAERRHILEPEGPNEMFLDDFAELSPVQVRRDSETREPPIPSVRVDCE